MQQRSNDVANPSVLVDDIAGGCGFTGQGPEFFGRIRFSAVTETGGQGQKKCQDSGNLLHIIHFLLLNAGARRSFPKEWLILVLFFLKGKFYLFKFIRVDILITSSKLKWLMMSADRRVWLDVYRGY